jgi:hypothetical protein
LVKTAPSFKWIQYWDKMREFKGFWGKFTPRMDVKFMLGKMQNGTAGSFSNVI